MSPVHITRVKALASIFLFWDAQFSSFAVSMIIMLMFLQHCFSYSCGPNFSEYEGFVLNFLRFSKQIKLVGFGLWDCLVSCTRQTYETKCFLLNPTPKRAYSGSFAQWEHRHMFLYFTCAPFVPFQIYSLPFAMRQTMFWKCTMHGFSTECHYLNT